MEISGYLLLLLSLALFMLSRILDDMSWYDLGVHNEAQIFQGVGIAGLTLCALLQIVRKYKIEGILKILFYNSQLKFVISWALIVTIGLLFFNIFGCTSEIPESSASDYFYMDHTGCCLNVVQIILTNLNFSLLCNTKAHRVELVIYEMILFAEIVYNANLLILFIGDLEGKVKDYSILLISIMIANQILIMDLIFRAAHEEKQREEIQLLKQNKQPKMEKQVKDIQEASNVQMIKVIHAPELLSPA